MTLYNNHPVEHVKTNSQSAVDMDALMNAYTMDCMTRICLSLELGAVKNPDNKFMSVIQSVFPVWRMNLAAMLPELCKLFDVAHINPDSCRFFLDVAEKTMNDRVKTGARKDDVIGLLMTAKEHELKRKPREERLLNDTLIARALMQLFLDGVGTLSPFICLVLYFLATHDEVRSKVTAEVDKLTTEDDFITGEKANEMKYLDQVIDETLRFASFPGINRLVTKPWRIPGTEIVLPVDMRVIIPVHPLHMDPEYFEEPHKFDPERFSPENKGRIRSCTFMPFGNGPRECLGVKVGRLETKVMLFHLLKNFEISPSPELPIPLKLCKEDFCRVDGGCNLILRKK